MAEIIQHETQEAQALRSKASPFTAKAHAPQPLREAGYNKRLEADMWGKVNMAVDKTARVVKAYSNAKDMTVARKTMKMMDFDHSQTMLQLSEHLHQTDIENLDLQETVANWEFRHAEHSDGFKIGKSDSSGKPTQRIFSQKLEDYNIPHSQKDALEKHYNRLEKQKTDYLVSSLPEILIGKAKFQLGAVTQDLKNKMAGIVQLQENYDKEIPPGMLAFYNTDPNRDLTVAEAEEISAERDQALMEPSKYTLNLSIDGNRQMLDLFEEFDKELLEVMNYGVISAEEAIVHQRVFTQDVLKTMFDADVSRDEDGAYLKLGNKGYYIDRNLLRGHSYSKKLQQKMHIDEKSTSAFVNTYNANKQKEADKAAKLVITNDKKSAIESYTREVQKEDSFDTMTYKEIVKGYVKSGADEYVAKQYANVWEANKAKHLAGIVDKDVTFQLHNLTAEILNKPDEFAKMFSTTAPDGQVSSIEGRPLKKALVSLAEKRLKQKKFDAMDERDRINISDPQNITLTRDEIKRIDKTASKIQPSSIQNMLNTKQAHEKEVRKNFLIGNIERQTGSAIGRNDIKERYLKYDPEREIYAPDHDKIDAIYKASGFDSNTEMGIHLNNIAKVINAEDEAEEKRLSKKKHVSTEYMTDDMFKKSMWEDAQVKKEMIANIAQGKTTVYSAYSQDVSKSYFNVNAESYLKTPKGEKDANFKARFEGGGITGVLTKTQKHYKNQMEQSFVQLYNMELSLLPTENTTKEVLEGYYLELQNNISKTGVHNKYTDTIARSIKERLRTRVHQLQRDNQKGTAFRQCFKDGDIDKACILKFEQAHGYPMSTLPGSVTAIDIANEMIREAGNLTEPMEAPPDETGQGVGNE